MLANVGARRRSAHGIVVRRLDHIFADLCPEILVRTSYRHDFDPCRESKFSASARPSGPQDFPGSYRR